MRILSKFKMVVVPLFVLLLRAINFAYSYIVVRLLSQMDFAIYSTYVYVCNFSYQALKYGFDFRFQKLLFKLYERDSSKVISLRRRYAFYAFKMAFLASMVAIILYLIFFQGVFSINYSDCIGLFLCCLSLFGMGVITSDCYARANIFIITQVLLLQFLSYGVASLCILYVGGDSAFFLYSFFSFIPVIYILLRFYGLMNGRVKILNINKLRRIKFHSEYIIYFNNLAINSFQLFLVSVIAKTSPLWISEYRVLQSIHSIVSLLPVAAVSYLLNNVFSKSKLHLTHSGFSLLHIYLIFVGFAVLCKDSLMKMFPQYRSVIDDFLLIYLFLNLLTIVSNSFVYSAHMFINIRKFLFFSLISGAAGMIATLFFSPATFQEFVFLDVAVQLAFYFGMLISTSGSIFNFLNVFNWLYCFVCYEVMRFSYFNEFEFGILLITASLLYFVLMRKLFNLKKWR